MEVGTPQLQTSDAFSLRRKLFWLTLLYFAEGFPFGVVYDMIPVYFRTFGVSLRNIGLLSLIGLPWSLKVFWSPAVDRFGQKKQWVMACLTAMAVLLFLLPELPPAHPSSLLWGLLLAFTICSATQDIAIDAFAIGLMSKGQEGPANSVRVSAYRAAIIVGGGGLVALAGLLSWPVCLRAGSVILLLLAVAAWRAPSLRIPLEARRSLFHPLWVWLKRPSAIPVFLFILVYKLGDASMGPMVL